ncbi:MAG: hypothetical protein AAFV53_37690 [Myxococcota bacterium]
MDVLALLKRLSAEVSKSPPSAQASHLAALDACVALTSAKLALPHAVKWLLSTRQVPSTTMLAEDARMSRFSIAGAGELRALAPRIQIRYAVSRHNSLVGNSAAGWAYAAIAILPELRHEDLLQPHRDLEALFAVVCSTRPDQVLYHSEICRRVLQTAPSNALLRVQYARETPDTRAGHEMMLLEIDGETAINYWPALGAEFNDFDANGRLAKACETLGLQAVSPMQLGAFLSVAASANANHSESWGGEDGLSAFEEGSIPYLMRTFTGEM